MIYLGQRGVRGGGPNDKVSEIYIDGHLLMSSVSPLSERRLASSALALHPGTGPLTVMVGGSGLGYTAQAALADPRVEKVVVIEAMDFVIDWMTAGYLPLSEELTSDPRFVLERGDVYGQLLAPPTRKFDLVLVDVDHAPNDRLSPASEPFYSVEGQRRVAQHVPRDGVVGVWSAHDDDPFAAVMAEVYANSQRERVLWEDLEQPEAEPYDNTLFFGVGVSQNDS